MVNFQVFFCLFEKLNAKNVLKSRMEGGSRLSEAVAQATLEQKLENKEYENTRDQYIELDNLLTTITDKRVHQCMVPLSKGTVN